jgi:DnaJ family protein C protein 16
LIFQENTRLPVVQVSMKDLPLATLLDVLESHQFLQLPRLSSQEVFDHLCPPGNLSRGRVQLDPIFYVKNHPNLSQFFFIEEYQFRSTLFVIDIF